MRGKQKLTKEKFEGIKKSILKKDSVQWIVGVHNVGKATIEKVRKAETYEEYIK